MNVEYIDTLGRYRWVVFLSRVLGLFVGLVLLVWLFSSCQSRRADADECATCGVVVRYVTPTPTVPVVLSPSLAVSVLTGTVPISATPFPTPVVHIPPTYTPYPTYTPFPTPLPSFGGGGFSAVTPTPVSTYPLQLADVVCLSGGMPRVEFEVAETGSEGEGYRIEISNDWGYLDFQEVLTTGTFYLGSDASLFHLSVYDLGLQRLADVVDYDYPGDCARLRLYYRAVFRRPENISVRW